MKILVVGSGGREHALCWAIGASPLCEALYCAPGNAGIAEEAECVPIKAEDIDGIVAFVQETEIDFVVVGPEAPLVAGLADRLNEAGVKTFGPERGAAELEGSKGFMKDACARFGVPTAEYSRFDDADKAKAYIREKGAPIVVKTDGLAAGKGVTVAQTLDEAMTAVDEAMLDGRFGKAGAEIVVEEFLQGEEVSFFALCDGANAVPLATAQDHKAVGEGDVGPNTGGMGAYSPAPIMNDDLTDAVMQRAINPIVQGLAAEGRPYVGVLFAGLMISDDGVRVLEYNVRFGDPECQVLLMRLMSDLLPALLAACDGQLRNFDLRWYDEAALCVVMAAEGYPGSYEKGTEIGGLEAAGAIDDVMVFHAGTEAVDGTVRATGGRVLGITALGETVGEAQATAYEAVDKLDWPRGFCRRDIGWRAVAREGEGS